MSMCTTVIMIPGALHLTYSQARSPGRYEHMSLLHVTGDDWLLLGSLHCKLLRARPSLSVFRTLSTGKFQR
jgi:hypothetical protein